MRALALLALFCAAPAMAQDASPPQSVLTGNAWTLTVLDGRPVTAARPPTLTMTLAGAIAGFAGCNSYFGQLMFADKDTVSASRIGLTRMACPPEAMALEAGFTQALQRVRSWSHAGGVITFDGDGGTLRFERK